MSLVRTRTLVRILAVLAGAVAVALALMPLASTAEPAVAEDDSVVRAAGVEVTEWPAEAGEWSKAALLDKAVFEPPVAAVVSDVFNAAEAEVAAGAAKADRTARRPAPRMPLGGVWDRLAQCESNGNWQANTGNGYYGGLQFLPSTWRSVGGTGLPHEHSREEQIRRAQILQARAGWGQWPACARRLGLLG